MNDAGTLSRTTNDDERQQARRMAESFVEVYQVTLIHVEQHLEDIIADAGKEYARGYEPWHRALHELINGTTLLAKEEKMPDRESFMDALRVFSFDSSARFLDDVCSSIGIRTDRGWQEKFHAHVQMLMQALQITQQRKMHS